MTADGNRESVRDALARLWDVRWFPTPLPPGLDAGEVARRQRQFIWRHAPLWEWSRALRYAAGWWALYGWRQLVRLNRGFPRPVLLAVADLLARLPVRQRVVRANLERAFPSASPAEREAIRRRFLRTAVASLMEVARMDWMTRDEIADRVPLVDGDRLRAAHASGPVVVLSAHYGAFPLVLARLGVAGVPVAVVVKRQKDPVFDQWWKSIRDRFNVIGIPDLPAGESLRLTLAHLRAGGVLVMAADQRGPGDEPLLPLFGHDCHTRLLPARLARRTGARIVPAFIDPPLDHRDGRQPLRVVEELLPGETDHATMIAWHRVLEDRIRARPHAFWWLHDRWRHYD